MKPIVLTDPEYYHPEKGELVLVNQQLTDQDIEKIIVPFLEQHPEITSLNMGNTTGIIVDKGNNTDYAHVKVAKYRASFEKTYNNTDLNQIGDEGAKALSNLINLTLLDISCNQIGDEGAKALANLINLTSLDVSSNSIGDEGAKALSNLTSLTSLQIKYNFFIGNEGSKALSNLINLTSLDVSGNQIGEEGAKALIKLIKLRSLHISGKNNISINNNFGKNYIGNEGAKALSNLTNLRSLDVSCNFIGEEGAKALANLTNLTSLDIKQNDIGDKGAKALATIINLTFPDIGWTSYNYNNYCEEGKRALSETNPLKKANFAIQVGIPAQPPSLLQFCLFKVKQISNLNQSELQIDLVLPTELSEKLSKKG